MTDSVDTLILDLLEWIGSRSRPYPEVIEAWHTSCPRLPVWEEANIRGFIEQHHDKRTGVLVSVTSAGMTYLRERRSHQPSPR